MIQIAAHYKLEMSSGESDTRLYNAGTLGFKDLVLASFQVAVFKKGLRGNEK